MTKKKLSHITQESTSDLAHLFQQMPHLQKVMEDQVRIIQQLLQLGHQMADILYWGTENGKGIALAEHWVGTIQLLKVKDPFPHHRH